VSADIAVNRQAFHNYEILEKFEAGVVLTGTEIKSARDGRVNLKDSYGLVKSGEVWLLNCHISPTLMEISPTTIPSYTQTSVESQ
jgi:SsrA-binding protein